MIRTMLLVLMSLLSGRAAVAQEAQLCRIVERAAPIPTEIHETSGLAMGRLNPNAFWTHNDGSATRMYAIASDGRLLGSVEVRGIKPRDWEDLEAGACGTGSCLYAADTGDNSSRRRSITIYEIPEPRLGATREVAARSMPAEYPDGPHDAEALFRASNGDLYIVTKGREGPIRLYRYPAPYRYDEVVRLEAVREIAAQPRDQRDRVSAATMTPDGRWAAILTYRTLLFYRADELLGGGALTPLSFDLSSLGQKQMEAVVVGADGSVWVTTESELQSNPSWSRLHCTLPWN